MMENKETDTEEMQPLVGKYIFRLFNGTTVEELRGVNFKVVIPWEKLMTAIEQEILLRPYETQKGWVISEEGITVGIGQKPGRKTNSS